MFLTPEDKAALRAPRGGRSPFSLPIRSTRATNLAIFRLVLESLKDSPLRILDVGCGSGALLEKIAEHYRERGWNPEEYLLGIDLDKDSFQAQVPFQTADLTQPLNVQVQSFDVVIAMEVLEHVRAPYLLLDEIYAALNPGGKFLFSIPNMMNINSRLCFLFTGRFQLYHGPSSNPEHASGETGHINPLPIQYWDYGLRYAGFSEIRYQTDRIKRGPLFPAILFAPLLWLGKHFMHMEERRYNESIYQQNLRPFREINTLRNLAGRGLLAVCTKPGEANQ